MSAPAAEVVFLLDVDNTLLDNDAFTAALRQYLTDTFGAPSQELYWAHFERRRRDLGYADYLGALQDYRAENPHDAHILKVSGFILDFPFAGLIYPGAFDVITRLSTWGPTVILSDGDVVFQPRKVERSGLAAAVDGHVLIYIHKEKELDDVERRYPARHYVLVDDKLRLLNAAKQHWGSRLTTVFPRQGHYALDPEILANYPPADVTVDRIGELLHLPLQAFVPGTDS